MWVSLSFYIDAQCEAMGKICMINIWAVDEDLYCWKVEKYFLLIKAIEVLWHTISLSSIHFAFKHLTFRSRVELCAPMTNILHRRFCLLVSKRKFKRNSLSDCV